MPSSLRDRFDRPVVCVVVGMSPPSSSSWGSLAGGTSGEGQRPRQTVAPLAARLGIPVNTQFSKGGETALAQLASRAMEFDPLVMVGRSHNVPAQATTLGKRFYPELWEVRSQL